MFQVLYSQDILRIKLGAESGHTEDERVKKGREKREQEYAPHNQRKRALEAEIELLEHYELVVHVVVLSGRIG